ncbi:hypothetical protein FF2_003211 [Malus domestica]
MPPSSLPLILPTSSPPPGADRHTITVFKADLLDADAVAKEQTWKEEERDRLKQKKTRGTLPPAEKRSPESPDRKARY